MASPEWVEAGCNVLLQAVVAKANTMTVKAAGGN
jgi:hypothetical protein